MIIKIVAVITASSLLYGVNCRSLNCFPHLTLMCVCIIKTSSERIWSWAGLLKSDVFGTFKCLTFEHSMHNASNLDTMLGKRRAKSRIAGEKNFEPDSRSTFTTVKINH